MKKAFTLVEKGFYLDWVDELTNGVMESASFFIFGHLSRRKIGKCAIFPYIRHANRKGK